MSLISTYQGRKSLFAEKLITKGVDASGSEGLTTLINKIGSIQHFSDGLYLYADKNIAQSTDTVNLYALYLENGVVQSGKTVDFIDTTVLKSKSTRMGEEYDVYLFLGKGEISFTSDKIYIENDSSTNSQESGSPSNANYKLEIDNGLILTKNGEAIVLSYITYDSSKSVKVYIKSSATNVVVKGDNILGTDTTDTSGIATASCSCMGIGSRNICAKSGSLQSEPYIVWDTIKFDNGTQDSHDDTLWQSLTYLSRGEEYSTFTFSSSQTLYTSVSSDVTIEFDVNLFCANSSPFISLRKNNDLLTAVTKQDLSITNDNWYHIKISIVNSVATVTNTTNDVTIPNLTVTDVNRFYFRNGSSEQVMFKNFKVYNS